MQYSKNEIKELLIAVSENLRPKIVPVLNFSLRVLSFLEDKILSSIRVDPETHSNSKHHILRDKSSGRFIARTAKVTKGR